MNPADAWPGFSGRSGLLIDTNLLVLYVVGTVNLDRIDSVKRTRQYTQRDYRLLVRLLNNFSSLYTLAHVMAEVSNLTDLTGPERLRARHVLRRRLPSSKNMKWRACVRSERAFRTPGTRRRSDHHVGPRDQLRRRDGRPRFVSGAKPRRYRDAELHAFTRA